MTKVRSEVSKVDDLVRVKVCISASVPRWLADWLYVQQELSEGAARKVLVTLVKEVPGGARLMVPLASWWNEVSLNTGKM